jgi:pseudaminic acid biosynthesis-associated methylase
MGYGKDWGLIRRVHNGGSMQKVTAQLKRWRDSFGVNYTKRNSLTVAQLNRLYLKRYGVSREELNRQFLKTVNRDARILEIGTNIGNQLACLKSMGFRNLYGLEPNPFACGLAKKRLPDAVILEGNAFDIPFKNGYFDLVFTSGVLIHIAPANLPQALAEIHRCSKRYIWGLEYFSDTCRQIEYRGEAGLLWKTDFLSRYLEKFPGLKTVRKRFLDYTDSDNRDIMFLLQK